MIQKYRAWEISGKRMISVKSIDFVNRFIEYIHRPYSNPYRILSEILEFDQIHLMQSTGLFDKNGVEIFKGDIVEYSLPLGYRGKGEVIFDEEYGWFNIDGFYAGIYDYPTLAFSEGTDNFEVIGNIHQHQHLLEGLNGG